MNQVKKNSKQLLPGIQAKLLKPVAALVQPQNLVVPMVITGIIAQVSDNLRDVKTPKEIQQLDSVKTYSKCLGIGDSRQLSAIHALASTLGPEASTLVSLSPEERKVHLEEVCNIINTVPGPAKVKASALVIQNEDELASHRRGLALQSRSNMQATPIYNRTDITMGISIKDLVLEFSIESAKQLWVTIGRDADKFDSLLLAQVTDAKTVTEAVIRIVKRNLVAIIKEYDDGSFTFGGDVAVLKGEDNLTPIERELGYMKRLQPSIPEQIEITSSVQVDPILQAALDQQKQVATAVTTSLQKVGKTPKSKKVNPTPPKAGPSPSSSSGSRRRTKKN